MTSRLRMVSMWRKDLCNINKTRDNHYREFGRYYDFTVLVRSNAEIQSHAYECGTNFIRVNCGTGILGLLMFYVRSFVWVIRENRKHKFDILHAPINEEVTGWLLYLLMLKKPFFLLDLWDAPALRLKSKRHSLKDIAWSVYENAVSYTIKAADALIVGIIPDGVRKYAVDPGKMILSENGVRLDVFSPGGDASREMEGGIELLYAGYLHPERGINDTIHAVSSLRERGVKCRLKLIGPSNPSALAEINNCIESLQMDSYVDVILDADSEVIPEYIADADACLCPLRDIEKYRWSYPVKIYEYLAMGKPVIASELPGTRSLIHDSVNGFLYKEGAIDQFVDALERCVHALESGSSFESVCRHSVEDKEWSHICKDISKKIKVNYDSFPRFV